ncbi:cytochrome c biogenesis protein CcsA, partial [Dactylosporangium aurantiacum]
MTTQTTNRSRHAGRARRDLGWAAGGLGAAGLLTALVVAPTDDGQGPAQRLMYLHVPTAWTAYLAFLTVLVAGGGYLLHRDAAWDRVARAAAEVGVGAAALTLALGALWGRATWGVWVVCRSHSHSLIAAMCRVASYRTASLSKRVAT